MATLEYNNQSYKSNSGETVLNTFLRNGVNVRFSCGNGTCQVCLLKSDKDQACPTSQKGLSKKLKDKDYFMPCTCVPEQDMNIYPPDNNDFIYEAIVVEKNLIRKDVCQIKLVLNENFDYKAGQFINIRPVGAESVRSYSLVSLPMVDAHLEIHVKKVENGVFSKWIFDKLKVNDIIEVQNAAGSCYYQTSHSNQKILMVGAGIGIAALYGILKDALVLNSHQGQIHFYHSVRKADELYLHQELKQLESIHSNFHYTACVSGESTDHEYSFGRASTIAFEQHKELVNWKVYLCGAPDMVSDSTDLALSFGADIADIHSDAFEFQNSLKSTHNFGLNSQTNKYEYTDDGNSTPQPDPEMWRVLKEGKLLTEILTEFYTIVFSDSRLSPFFSHVTKQRLIEKQYNFLYQMFTGQKVYFGLSLRNAHHWMVISDDLFDYRAEILKSLMIKYGLPEHLVNKWCALEESSRSKIVKSKSWDKVLDGKTVCLDKFEEAVMTIASLCDSCHEEIAAGEKIRYHLRLGKAFCSKCAGLEDDPHKTEDQLELV